MAPPFVGLRAHALTTFDVTEFCGWQRLRFHKVAVPYPAKLCRVLATAPDSAIAQKGAPVPCTSLDWMVRWPVEPVGRAASVWRFLVAWCSAAVYGDSFRMVQGSCVWRFVSHGLLAGMAILSAWCIAAVYADSFRMVLGGAAVLAIRFAWPLL